MVLTDSDLNYVKNCFLPETKQRRMSVPKLSHRIPRMNEFSEFNPSLEQLDATLRKPPLNLGQESTRNLHVVVICLQTKFKINVEIGFVQYFIYQNKLTITRIYVGKIYRNMNYTAFVYLSVLRILFKKHDKMDKICVLVLESNLQVQKFFKFLGFKIGNIFTDNKNAIIDYYHEFTLKTKHLETVLSSFK